MLVETLEDTKVYLKATLLQCLIEANELEGSTNGKIQHTYKTVLRREKEGIEVYTNVRRDPVTNYRMYTGLNIRQIVEYEMNRAKGVLNGQS